MCVCTRKYFFAKKPGGQNTMFDPQVNFWGGVIWPPNPRFPRPWCRVLQKKLGTRSRTTNGKVWSMQLNILYAVSDPLKIWIPATRFQRSFMAETTTEWVTTEFIKHTLAARKLNSWIYTVSKIWKHAKTAPISKQVKIKLITPIASFRKKHTFVTLYNEWGQVSPRL